MTLKDIADATGFSLVSVHRAMNGKSGVSEKTRQKILSAARDMGYTANLMASVLKRKTVNIAIVIPERERAGAFYFNYMWKGCRDYMNDISGYQINFIEYPFELCPGAQLEEQDQLKALDRLYAEHGEELDGLLTVPMLNTAALQESLERFIQHGNQRSVTGEIYCSFVFHRFVVALISLPNGDIKSDKCFACSGHTGHKADALLASLAGAVDNVEDEVNGGIGGCLVGLVARDFLHRMR